MSKHEKNPVKWDLFFLLIVSFAGIVTLTINLLFVMPPGVTEIPGEVYPDQRIRVIENDLKGPYILRVNDTSKPLVIKTSNR